MRDRDIAKAWDSDLGLSYIPKAELFGVTGAAESDLWPRE